MKEKTKCIPMDLVLTSNPPQNKCKNCGQTWFCNAEPPTCHLEEKKCEHTGTIKDIVGCEVCHPTKLNSPIIKDSISHSDKTVETITEDWHKQALELSEVDELTETINNGKYVEAHIVKELIISTVIKTKEEFYQKVKSVLAWVGNKESIRVLENLAKSENLNLEEPSK